MLEIIMSYDFSFFVSRAELSHALLCTFAVAIKWPTKGHKI